MSVLRLIQFTDPHLYGNETETLRGIATLPALKAALADAQQSSAWPPDVVLVTGDLVQDDPADTSISAACSALSARRCYVYPEIMTILR